MLLSFSFNRMVMATPNMFYSIAKPQAKQIPPLGHYFSCPILNL